MNQKINLVVENSVTFVSGSIHKTVYQELKKQLGYTDPQSAWKSYNSKNNKNKKNKFINQWDGKITTVCYNKKWCKCSIKKDGVHFPTGLLSKARKVFDAYEVKYNLIDNRNSVELNPNKYTMSPNFDPRDYQQEIINNAVKQQRGIIKMATGAGKTATAAGIIASLGITPFIFYVTSQDLLTQAKEELEKFIYENGKPISVGIVGAGKKEIKDITVMTVQTAIRCLGEKYEKYDDEDTDDKSEIKEFDKKDIFDLIHNAKGMICDEVQHWAARTCQVIADHSISCRYKWGLSATPWRDMGDDILIDACFGKPICDVNASFLIKKGILVKPSIYFVHCKNNSKASGTYATIYKQCVVENNERNLIISNIAKNMKESGRQILILVKNIRHGEILESLIDDSVFINGSHSSKIRKSHINDMKKGNAKITISTNIFDEGIDVKPLDALILAGGGKSHTRALQRIGRVIRQFKDKKDAFVVDFYDDVKYLRKHSESRRKIYLSEPEFEVKDFNF